MKKQPRSGPFARRNVDQYTARLIDSKHEADGATSRTRRYIQKKVEPSTWPLP